MARVSKRKVNGKRTEFNRLDKPYRQEFEDSLGTVEIWGQDYPVAHLMHSLHPYELKMRYIKYLQDKNIDMGAF
jgi:hypothetical protein